MPMEPATDPRIDYMLSCCLGAVLLQIDGQTGSRHQSTGKSLLSVCSRCDLSGEWAHPSDPLRQFRVKRLIAQILHHPEIEMAVVGEAEDIADSFRRHVDRIQKASHPISVGMHRQLVRLQREAWFVGQVLVEFLAMSRECLEHGESWAVPKGILGELQLRHEDLQQRLAPPLTTLGEAIHASHPALHASSSSHADSPSDEFAWMEIKSGWEGIQTGSGPAWPIFDQPGPKRRRLRPLSMTGWSKVAGIEPKDADNEPKEPFLWPMWERPVLSLPRVDGGADGSAPFPAQAAWTDDPIGKGLMALLDRCPNLEPVLEWRRRWRDDSGWLKLGGRILVDIRLDTETLYQIWTQMELRAAIRSMSPQPRIEIHAKVLSERAEPGKSANYYDDRGEIRPLEIPHTEKDIRPCWPHLHLDARQSGGARDEGRRVHVQCFARSVGEDLGPRIEHLRSTNQRLKWDHGLIACIEPVNEEVLLRASEGFKGQDPSKCNPLLKSAGENSANIHIVTLQPDPQHEARNRKALRDVLEKIVETSN